MTVNPHQNLQRAREYLAAVEAGARGDALRAFYAPDVVQVAFPNRLTPKGATRRLQGLLAAAERGREVLSAQRYEELNALAEGDRVALELEGWAHRPAAQLRLLRAVVNPDPISD